MGLRALLVVDRRFLVRDGSYYTEGPTGAETGDRYLQWFDEVVVAGREAVDTGQDITCLNKISSLGLRVELLPNISGLKERMLNISVARSRLHDMIIQSDAVIARLPTELGIEAANLAIECQKPLAIDLGGCVLDGLRAHGSLAGKIYAPVAYHRLRHVVRKADWVAYVTQTFLQKRYPAKKWAQTVAASDVEIPSPSQDVLNGRFIRINSDTPLVFGTIGSLVGQFKGIHIALSSLAMATPNIPQFTYRVLGGGDITQWRNLATRLGLADRIIFDGTLPAGEAVFRWLDGIDIYLQPSLREGLPRALIEAMSRGCPALASSIAGIPELLPPEFLHRPGDTDQLASQVVNLIDPLRQQNCAQQNYEKAKRYTQDVCNKIRGEFWAAFRDSANISISRGLHRSSLGSRKFFRH